MATVFEKLDELKIDNAFISKVSHSEIKEFKKEVEVEAIRNAKEKADYLLAAIGQETGTALIINERNFNSDDNYARDIQTRGSRSMSQNMYEVSEKYKSEGTIEFRKINIQIMIYTKFEIK